MRFSENVAINYRKVFKQWCNSDHGASITCLFTAACKAAAGVKDFYNQKGHKCQEIRVPIRLNSK